MAGKFFVFGLLQTFLVANLSYNEAVEFKFTNFVCENLDKSFFSIQECRLRAINRNKTILNANLTLLQTLSEMDVTAQLFKKANGYKPWLYKINIDACRFRKKAYNPVAGIIFNLFKDFSNLDHPCPYEGTIYVKGFYLRWNLLPNAIPTGDYLLTCAWNIKNKTKLITNVYFVFREDFINI